MKSTRLTAALLLLVSLTLALDAIAAPRITLTPVDPLVKIFPDTTELPAAVANQADVARGEHASFQFALRTDQPLRDLRVSVQSPACDDAALAEAAVGYLGCIRAPHLAPNAAHDRLRPVESLFPDPILPDPPATVEPNALLPIWITIPIPADAPAGLYLGKATLTATASSTIRIQEPLVVRVHPVTIKKTRLWITNWWPGHQSTNTAWLEHMNAGQPVERFSDRYWQLHRSLARTMADYRQNVALISPLHFAHYQLENSQWKIDFSDFDRMVQVFIDEGVIGRIEGGHLATRTADQWQENSSFSVFVPTLENDSVHIVKMPLSDHRAQDFFNQFIPALVDHLKQKGWLDIYTQHIADEPVKENADSWIAIARLIKQLAPDLPLVDATLSPELAGTLHTWVPTLEGWHKNADFYAKRTQAGDELWFYTCIVPQGEYANRFLDLPLIKTRLLHWINFRYGATGYLHWGFNYWDDQPYRDACLRDLPAGDAWIAYPAPDALIPSIRLEAMRDGIVDYELLALLKQRDPDAADRLARRLIYDFNNYNTSVADFRQTRRELLELLGQSAP